jgi:hypothetical protein
LGLSVFSLTLHVFFLRQFKYFYNFYIHFQISIPSFFRFKRSNSAGYFYVCVSQAPQT